MLKTLNHNQSSIPLNKVNKKRKDEGKRIPIQDMGIMGDFGVFLWLCLLIKQKTTILILDVSFITIANSMLNF